MPPRAQSNEIATVWRFPLFCTKYIGSRWLLYILKWHEQAILESNLICVWCAGEWELVISQLGITAKTKANNDCSFGVRNGAFAQRKHFRKLFSGKCGEEENFLFGREIKSIMIRIGREEDLDIIATLHRKNEDQESIIMGSLSYISFFRSHFRGFFVRNCPWFKLHCSQRTNSPNMHFLSSFCKSSSANRIGEFWSISRPRLAKLIAIWS